MRRWVILVGVAAALAAPEAARAQPTLAEGAPQTGHVHLVAGGADGIVELADGAETPVATTDAESGLEAAPEWTCRTSRTFAATTSGGERSAPLTVTTPDCSTRLAVRSFRTAGLGDNLRVAVEDTWRLGDFSADVCALRPDGRRICQTVSLPKGLELTNAVFAMTRPGTWTIEVSGPVPTIVRRVTVVRRHYPRGRPTVLATGDSMMLSTTTALQDLLTGVARRVRDIYVGSGISRPFVVDWARLPRRQNRAYHPDAVVVSLGMADGRDLPSPDGPVACCGPDYVAAYAARARRMMKTWSRGGRTAVVWTNEPYQRDTRRDPFIKMVNDALPIAARGLERVEVLDFASYFTPGATYRDSMVRDGRTIRLRTEDGTHMSRPGGRIAARMIARALHGLGVTGRL